MKEVCNMTFKEAMEMLSDQVVVYKINTKDDELVEIIKYEDVYVIEAVKIN